MKDKNYIGKQNNYVFKLNRHHRTLDVSTDGYKKKDILKMLKSESGTITFWGFAKKPKALGFECWIGFFAKPLLVAVFFRSTN
jgi:hypothetical protein